MAQDQADITPSLALRANQQRPPRRRFDATVEVNRALCREHFVLRLRIDPQAGIFPATRPGQFIQLGCRTPDGAILSDDMQGREIEWQPGQRVQLRQPEICGPLALLRRPFSLAGHGDDARGTWVEVVHRVVGVGTDWLARLKPGDAVDFIGPLGNWFDLPAGKSIAMMVGGGVGLPPMFYLAEALKAAGWDAIGFVGAMTRDLLAVDFVPGHAPASDGQPTPSVAQFASLGFPALVTTDDGSLGLKGKITLGLEKWLQAQSAEQKQRTVVFTCGPHGMMHAVAKLAAAHGVDCQVCLEQAMACGMGTCQSCVVKIEDAAKPQATTPEGRPWRFKLACNDGPVFPATMVVW